MIDGAVHVDVGDCIKELKLSHHLNLHTLLCLHESAETDLSDSIFDSLVLVDCIVIALHFIKHNPKLAYLPIASTVVI